MLNLKFKIKKLKFQKGIAALITILTLGGIIFVVSLTTSLLAFWQGQNADSIKKSTQAYYAAYSGLQDALIKLERDQNFSGSFNLSVNTSNDTSVSVSNIDSSATITVTASKGDIQKKMETVVDIDTTTGLITPTSTAELTL